MVDLGPENLLVNSQKVLLFLGGDEFIQLYDIKPHFGRPEQREPTTDGGVRYYYGSGDHYFEATMLGTTDQISALNTKTERDSLGNTPTSSYTIRCIAKDGTTVNITVDAFLRDLNLDAGEEGFLEFRCFFRITSDTITVV